MLVFFGYLGRVIGRWRPHFPLVLWGQAIEGLVIVDWDHRSSSHWERAILNTALIKREIVFKKKKNNSLIGEKPLNPIEIKVENRY